MYKKTKCLIIEDEGYLNITGEEEPCFIKEATELFRGNSVGSSLKVKVEHKEELLDIAKDYFFEITFIGDKREKFRGRHYAD